jgi:uncharacterized paraquat-inducible protein A
MNEETIICTECESEFQVVEVESQYHIGYCPYCGEELTSEEE